MNPDCRRILADAIRFFYAVEMAIADPQVLGVDVDSQSRCAHYGTARDIVAIKMKCCGSYYACKDCHEALASHEIEPWPRDQWDQSAVLCGACGHQITISQYLRCADKCPHCSAHFNPKCREHYHFYFDMTENESKPIH